MSKEESLQIKGIAFIMMLWCHFYISGHQYNSFYLFKFGDFKLFDFLNGACHPVVFFVILSGYGLYHVFEKGDKNRFTRITKLYIHYWIITIFFTTIAHLFANNEKYPGSIEDIILNLTAFKTTWNHECWFLFPYSILALSYPYIFNFIKKHGVLWGLGISLFLFFISGYTISRFGTGGSISNPIVNNIVQVGFMLFPFIVGALSSKNDVFLKVKKKCSSMTSAYFSFFTLIIVIVIKCFVSSAIINPIYAFIFITLYLLTKRNWISTFFEYIGKHSMNMWMIHTWLMVYIFPDFFYCFKNPIIILTIVLIACLVISITTNIFIEMTMSILKKSRTL